MLRVLVIGISQVYYNMYVYNIIVCTRFIIVINDDDDARREEKKKHVGIL